MGISKLNPFDNNFNYNVKPAGLNAGGINTGGASGVSAVSKVNGATFAPRAGQSQGECDCPDVSGSHLGCKLDLRGIENYAWGKEPDEFAIL